MAHDYRNWALLHLLLAFQKYLPDLLDAKITVELFSHDQKITTDRLLLPDGGLRYVRAVLKRLPWLLFQENCIF